MEFTQEQKEALFEQDKTEIYIQNIFLVLRICSSASAT